MLTCLLHACTPLTRLLLASYTLARLLHASYTPLTRLLHAYTPLTRLLHASYTPRYCADMHVSRCMSVANDIIRYSVYLLYWYKRTNTDAGGHNKQPPFACLSTQFTCFTGTNVQILTQGGHNKQPPFRRNPREARACLQHQLQLAPLQVFFFSG
jgi:hypothetical protein